MNLTTVSLEIWESDIFFRVPVLYPARQTFANREPHRILSYPLEADAVTCKFDPVAGNVCTNHANYGNQWELSSPRRRDAQMYRAGAMSYESWLINWKETHMELMIRRRALLALVCKLDTACVASVSHVVTGWVWEDQPVLAMRRLTGFEWTSLGQPRCNWLNFEWTSLC